MGLLTNKPWNRIEFWIVLLLIVRLPSITHPPIEIAHNWRQVTGNMITRNFLEADPNIMHPMLDNGGATSGITGTEFPLLNYLGYLLSLVFGFKHWWGRLINLLVSSAGIWFFFQLVKRFFGERQAFYAALLLLFSISWFLFSRKGMPDTFSTSLVLAGMYYTLRYFDSGSPLLLAGSVCCITAGILSKIPAGYLLVVLTPLIWQATIPLSRKLWFALLMVTGLAFVGFWYFVWVPHLVATSGFWHYYMGVSLKQGLNEMVVYGALAWKKYWIEAAGVSGFILMLGGIWRSVKAADQTDPTAADTRRLLWFAAAASTALFVLFMIKAGRTFALHSYYIVPFTPVMAFVGGYYLAKLPGKFSLGLLFLFALENLANAQHDLFYKESEAYKLKLEMLADQVSQRPDLVAINGTDNPQELYFTHRKGWSLDNEQLLRPGAVDSLSALGCKWLFINKHHLSQDFPYPVALSESDYVIYRLTESRRSE